MSVSYTDISISIAVVAKLPVKVFQSTRISVTSLNVFGRKVLVAQSLKLGTLIIMSVKCSERKHNYICIFMCSDYNNCILIMLFISRY